MTYDLIGTISDPTGTTLTDDFGNGYSEMAPIAGYHVNVLEAEDISIFSPFIIDVVTPVRAFSGRDDAVYLKFVDRDEWLALGIEEVV